MYSHTEKQRANDAQKTERHTHRERKQKRSRKKRKGGQGMSGDLVEALRWP